MPVNGAGDLLNRCALAAAAVALACALAWPSMAAAETFFINTAGDETDTLPGDEFCSTATGKCSLRAALEESNKLNGTADQIFFEEEEFEAGDPPIELSSGLPTITDPLVLAGRACETGAGSLGPCVQINGPANAAALRVAGAEERVDIELLSVTGAKVGVEVEDAEVRLRSSWLGLGVDGSTAGNATGILVGPGSEKTQIGGEGSEARNFFFDSGVAADLYGASKVKVLGNAFGVGPDGAAGAANGADISVASSTGAVASDNTIGTRVSPAAAATPACDGGCNLISGSQSSGIDLAGDGADRLPAVGTTIAGNQIGLGGGGAGSLPNAGAAILVGAAPHTVIGGPRPEDANSIVGTGTTIDGTLAPYLVVRGNLIGSPAGASGPGDLPEMGILATVEELALPAEEAQILDNEIGLDGGTGIAQRGFGGEVAGNRVTGATVGIRIGSSESRVESNRIEAPEDVGILVESGFNTLVGNHVVGSGGPGIKIQGSGLFGISGNLVGGETAASENVIDDSDGAAIEIVNPISSRNEVARNRGAGNGGPFVDLVASAPDPADLEPGDPNGGILPPAITLISETGASGFAEPGATVRVFRKSSTAVGEVQSFLGRAAADGGGNWSLSFPAPLSPGTAIGATQSLAFGTSELEITAVPVPERGGTGQGSGGAAGDRTAPRTKMLKQPRKVQVGRLASFAFTSNEAGSSFQCSLDRGKFKPCKSPKKYRLSKPGKHLFRVRAIDAAGNVDRTPVRRRFEVIG